MLQFFGSTISIGQKHNGVAKAAQAVRQSAELKLLNMLSHEFNDHSDLSNSYLNYYLQLIELMKDKDQQFILGGDHSQSISSIAAILSLRPRTGVIWIDAHGDINTPETSPTGLLHGMPLAVLLGLFDTSKNPQIHFAHGVLKSNQIVLIGVRDLDPGEKKIIERLGIRTYTRHDISQLGATEVTSQAIDYLKTQNYDDLHVSFDIDAIDPTLAPATGVPCADGLTLDDTQQICEILSASQRVKSLEIVELNPDLANTSKVWREMCQLVDFISWSIMQPNANQNKPFFNVVTGIGPERYLLPSS
jgi:arginase